MQLSPHFTLAEFVHSQAAARLGRLIEPDDAVIHNLRGLCVEVLEPIRSACDDRVIVISSGYRPRWLNVQVGGSPNSAHLYGCAADFTVVGMTPFQVCQKVQALDLDLDQCIHEFPPSGWCHVARARPGLAPRRMFFTTVRREGRSVNIPGIRLG